ncbi:PREDICTED: solute carrier family 22 member 13-like isoform X1 [Crocodylus porosus]|uniref:solute carrier family 22 member 13-like isoform X1 n=1 Tax=Crocodylus porosus TaxID=8502 RepID=UPI00093BBB5F|nr:PREDICTED: solute carrier family 22 member 13-like isoform X1 [Crocodylus porosus]
MTDTAEVLKAAGDCGRFQIWLVVLISLACPSLSFHLFSQIFMVQRVPHHCDTSWILEINPNLTKEEQLNLTIPRNTQGSYEECYMYTPVDWDLDSIRRYGLNSTEKCRDGWVYVSSEETLITKFDLVCDRKEQTDISQSIFMLGLLIGAFIFGSLSDSIGRRPTTLVCLLIQGVFGIGTAFVPNFYVYVALRWAIGAAVSGVAIGTLALATEWVGISYRPHAVIISHCWFAFGQMTLAGLAYGIRNWRMLQIAGSAPVFALFFYIWVFPESARWLMAKGKIKDAKKLFQKAAVMNKRTIPPELLDELTPEKESKSGNILDVFRKRHLRKVTLIMSAAWFVNSLVYYGVSLNVGNFGLDIYLTQLVFGAVEIPARFSCIYLLQWFGRKKSQSGCLLLGGIMCLIITGIPKDLPVVTTTLAVIGKFSIAASFSVSYVYSAELFPTVVRQTGVGLCSMSARLGGIISPLIGLLGTYNSVIPMAIFGGTPVIGGILCCLLPETRGKELQDGTEEPVETQWSSDNASLNGPLKQKEDSQEVEGTKTTRF